MTTEIKAPVRPDEMKGTKIFLGGSIEMGKAELWQDRLVKDLSGTAATLLNPRRDDWDSSWIQDPTPGTQFHEQVTWEMDMQEQADAIVYYFDPNTISPITLLELGTYHNQKPTYVCCPPEYPRYGNVRILCDRHGISFVETYDELLWELKDFIADAPPSESQDWEQYLNDPRIKVIMDNDGWWFAWKEGFEPEDQDEDDVWFGGGEGPYGVDLLGFMLARDGIEMEWV